MNTKQAAVATEIVKLSTQFEKLTLAQGSYIWGVKVVFCDKTGTHEVQIGKDDLDLLRSALMLMAEKARLQVLELAQRAGKVE